ncbi:MAG: hypothetical protein RR147_01790 [Oscillospiraceae bacterium]
MNDFEKMSREISSGGKKSAFNSAVNSTEGKRIGKIVDGEALKRAMAEGDKETMSRILNQVMSTRDGQALVKRISESFGKK